MEVAKRKKVFIVLHQSNLSGASKYLLNYLPYIKDQFDLSFIINKSQTGISHFKPYGEILQFKADRSGYLKLILVKLGLYHHLKVSWMNRILKKGKPDLILINSSGYNVLSETALHSGFKTTVISHESDFLLLFRSNMKWVDLFLEKAEHLIVCSTRNKELLATQLGYNDKNVSVLNGSFEPTIEKAASVSPKSTVNVACIGGINFIKGTDIFLRIAKRITAENANYNFYWIGGDLDSRDPFTVRLKKIHSSAAKKEKITFVPHLPFDKVNDFVSTMDIVINTSREDTFPLSILDAMALGKPIVAFDICGFREMLGDNYPHLVSYLDVPGFIDQLSAVSKELDALGKQCKARSEMFSVSLLGPQFKEIINKIVNQ